MNEAVTKLVNSGVLGALLVIAGIAIYLLSKHIASIWAQRIEDANKTAERLLQMHDAQMKASAAEAAALHTLRAAVEAQGVALEKLAERVDRAAGGSRRG